MKICVVGSTGYIGSTISKYLSKQGHQVIGVSRKFPKNNKEFRSYFSEIINGDVKSLTVLNSIISKKPDAIIYTVSLNHKDSEQDLHKSIKINCLPLIRLTDIIKKNKIKTKFIYFSTMQVYGNYSKIKLINESTKKDIKNYYALTHSICEDVLAAMNSNSFFESTSIRLSNGYGNPVLKSCDCWWLVINDFCNSAVKNRKIVINSDGTPLRDFIHIEDIANAVNKLIKTNKKLPKIINLASGKTLSMLDIADKVSKLSSRNIHHTDIEIRGIVPLGHDVRKKINKIKKNKKFKISTTLMKKYKINQTVNLSTGIKKMLMDIKVT